MDFKKKIKMVARDPDEWCVECNEVVHYGHITRKHTYTQSKSIGHRTYNKFESYEAFALYQTCCDYKEYIDHRYVLACHDRAYKGPGWYTNVLEPISKHIEEIQAERDRWALFVNQLKAVQSDQPLP